MTARVVGTAVVDTREVLLSWKGVDVYLGGYGSDLAPDPGAPGSFFLLTDRGPNFDLPDESLKGFVVPDFVPHIGRFRLEGGRRRLVRVERIPLRGADGRPLTGLPNPPGAGGTGETPVALDGGRLPFDPEGVDPEGLVALPDGGGFWLADEYGPSLLRVDAAGRVVERVSAAAAAAASAGRRLPRVLARRWPNRSLEGLAMLPDGRTLVTVLQSTLDNPSPAVRATSRVSRIVLFDTASGATRQYLYEQDAPGMSLSGVAALSEQELLVVEHDRKLPGDADDPAALKRVYRVELAGAADVSDPADGPAGLLVAGGRTPEELTPDALRALGVAPARKHLVADLVALGYPHDKPEGIALLDGGRTLVILNDDDFGIDADDRGGIRPKVLPMTGAVDRNELYFLALDDEDDP